MKVLGIDPGTRRMGFGAISLNGSKLEFLKAGLIKITATNDAEALREAKEDVDRLIREIEPDFFAIEKLFFTKNRTTGIAVAQARGVAVLAATEKGLPIIELSPNAVKLGITGYGGADKKSVYKMVRLTLKGLPEDLIDDASDALAIAIVASSEAKRENFLKKI